MSAHEHDAEALDLTAEGFCPSPRTLTRPSAAHAAGHQYRQRRSREVALSMGVENLRRSLQRLGQGPETRQRNAHRVQEGR
jgi:hypothetical protein